ACYRLQADCSGTSAPGLSRAHSRQLAFYRAHGCLKTGACRLYSRLEERARGQRPRPIVLVDAIVRPCANIGGFVIRGAGNLWQKRGVPRWGACLSIGAGVRRHHINAIDHKSRVDLSVSSDLTLDVRLAVKGGFFDHQGLCLVKGINDLRKMIKRLGHGFNSAARTGVKPGTLCGSSNTCTFKTCPSIRS